MDQILSENRERTMPFSLFYDTNISGVKIFLGIYDKWTLQITLTYEYNLKIPLLTCTKLI